MTKETLIQASDRRSLEKGQFKWQVLKVNKVELVN